MSAAEPMAYRIDKPRCRACGHPGIHHDAGECWTLPDGTETWDDSSDNCQCFWYEPEGDES